MRIWARICQWLARGDPPRGDVTHITLTRGSQPGLMGGMSNRPLAMEDRPALQGGDDGTCRCGCGTSCKGRYAPGHDAKHKSYLAKLTKGSDPYLAEQAVRLMVEIGWGTWVTPEILERVPQRNEWGRTTSHIDLVDMWFVDLAGVKHTHRRCQAIERTIERFTIGRPAGWDLCKWCTHTESYREEWERAAMRKASAKEAMRQVARRPPKVAEPVTWTVEPDGPGVGRTRTLHPDGRVVDHPRADLPCDRQEGSTTKRGLVRPPSVWQTSH
jgi:hypothetical protein